MLVYDVLPPSVTASACSFGFQLAPGCSVELGASRVSIATGEATLALVGSAGLSTPTRLEGSVSPPGGWVSPRYGELIPAPQVRFGAVGKQRLTAFALHDGSRTENLRVDARSIGEDGIRLDVRNGSRSDTLVLNLRGSAQSIRTDGLEFRGDLLWARREDGRATELRWINGTSLGWSSARVWVEAQSRQRSLVVRAGSELVVRGAPRESLSITWGDHAAAARGG